MSALDAPWPLRVAPKPTVAPFPPLPGYGALDAPPAARSPTPALARAAKPVAPVATPAPPLPPPAAAIARPARAEAVPDFRPSPFRAFAGLLFVFGVVVFGTEAFLAAAWEPRFAAAREALPTREVRYARVSTDPEVPLAAIEAQAAAAYAPAPVAVKVRSRACSPAAAAAPAAPHVYTAHRAAIPGSPWGPLPGAGAE